MTPDEILQKLWRDAGHDAGALDNVSLTGAEPGLPSSFRVGAAAQVSIAAATLAAAELWQARGGKRGPVSVAMDHACAEVRSDHYVRVNGEKLPEPWDKIAGLYPCRDGFVRIHTNFPHHRDGILKLLGCDYSREAVGAALANWDRVSFETACAEAGMVASALRTFAERDAHPHATALARMPLVSIEKIGDAPAEPLHDSERPLGGVRVLDLTRIIAGPVAGRTLAAHGASVLLITSAHLPSIPALVVDTGRGKRSAQLDLRDASDKDGMRALIADSDIFLQGYRPGGLASLGFSPEECAALRPGIVYVSLSAYGHEGPWANKRGFDSLVQAATGFNLAEGEAFGDGKPKVFPTQILDHAAGMLLAFGAMTALKRRVEHGGSWHVRVSLAGVAHWLRGLGRLPNGFAAPDPTFEDAAPYLEKTASPFGEITAVRHAGILSQTPAYWAQSTVPLGTDTAEWRPR
ncbi:formyl-coenzyme A transferase [Variibacter gotjawalensis]|uniref:Formyl-coenzyme A transferase n=1 Tax=Variibacter gotjawalensis TaxID=1333996 RepID=A0A0S3PT28_9BRAD|nr:CoA transferase [Variibacter gotjawalensis]NIK49396.1 crotonobetainyl-CoA:carnitine CoA-transferase CaiB-like acyl-CoA transferase [Variibacter gotjawalensis]RZS51248.1 crotonobetainyl-CoA:carnitine CoA-transferase CaiB-like acyl-CoA transferase [Variibacter gotjawalensis]BAT59081.1 formyl-coenzyme A transferase [Variibacter gotjawalensis]